MVQAAAGAGALAWRLRARADAPAVEAAPAPTATIDWADVGDSATVGLELGYGLVGMVDETVGAPLMARITGIRRQLSKELGFVVPVVRVRDNIALSPFAYRVIVDGVVAGEDEAWPDDLLALEAGAIDTPIEGRAVKDPSFGLDARWIDPALRDLAIASGYTVVDAATVIGTHLNHLLTGQAQVLLGQDEVQKLLDTLAETQPQLVGGLVPKTMSLQTVTAVLQNLLAEGVPVRDMRRIVAGLAAIAGRTTDPDDLTELLRPSLAGLIVQKLAGVREPLTAITFDGALEDLLAQAVRAAPGSAYPFEPVLAGRVADAVRAASEPLVASAQRFAVITTPLLRRPIWGLLKGQLPDAAVLSFTEIPDGKAIDVAAVVGGNAP